MNIRNNDKRFWSINKSYKGNSYATIRFLPQPEGEDDAWITFDQHMFQTASGRFFVEPCPRTIGNLCPICELQADMRKGTDDEKLHARRIKSRKRFISNIYIVNDGQDKYQNGSVYLFSYGESIMKHIQYALSPVQGDSCWNPFDFWTGSDLVLRYEQNVEPVWECYDNSVWAPQGPLKGSDDELEAIWNQQESLQQFLEPDYYMDQTYLWNKYISYMDF